jgi:hypothetical protein
MCACGKAFQELKREPIDLSLRKAAGAEANEPTAAPLVDQNFTHDAARGVAGAEKQNMVRTLAHGLTIRIAVMDTDD